MASEKRWLCGVVVTLTMSMIDALLSSRWKAARYATMYNNFGFLLS